MIEGPELERSIRQAMARDGVATLAELSRRTRIRRDTFYGWFRKPLVNVSAESVDKLTGVLDTKPGDPWYREPIVRTLDPEALAMLDEAVSRAMDRLADRLIAFLDERLPGNGQPAGS